MPRRTISTGCGTIEAGWRSAARPIGRRRAARHARRPRRGRVALGVRLGAARDHVGEHGDRVEVAELRQPRQPERVEPVAGQQREVGILRPQRRGPRRSAAGSPRGSPRRSSAYCAAPRRVAPCRRSCDRGRERPPSARRRPQPQAAAPRRASGRHALRAGRPAVSSSAPHAISANAAAAASRVRVDVLARVGERREPRLELRRRRVDAARQQRAAPGAVGLGVARGGAGVVAHRRLGEEHGQQPGASRDLRPARSPAASRSPPASACVVAARRGRPSSSRSRSVARPAATASGLPLSVPGLVDVAGRRDPPHQLGRAAVGRGRQPAAERPCP